MGWLAGKMKIDFNFLKRLGTLCGKKISLKDSHWFKGSRKCLTKIVSILSVVCFFFSRANGLFFRFLKDQGRLGPKNSKLISSHHVYSKNL